MKRGSMTTRKESRSWRPRKWVPPPPPAIDPGELHLDGVLQQAPQHVRLVGIEVDLEHAERAEVHRFVEKSRCAFLIANARESCREIRR